MSVHHVPAGVEAYSFAKLLYTQSHELERKERSKFSRGCYQWAQPNRTITVRGEHIAAPPVYDSVMPLLGAQFYKDIGIKYVLANPTHKKFYAEAYLANNLNVIVDSGGFQMLSGVSDYIDPDALIKGYNSSATIGMPLDLPIRRDIENYFFNSISNLIKANDEYIIPRLRPGVDLALISHGTTLDLRKRRLDVIDRKANVVAIAGLGIRTPDGVDQFFSAVENLMYVTDRYRKKTRYFHVLGVTKQVMFFVYSLLSVSGFVKEIGADSVSYRLDSLTGRFLREDFSFIQLNKTDTHRVPLSCPCPVCSTVKDSRLMNNGLLLESHNLWVREQQTRYTEYMARAFLSGHVAVHDVLKFLQVSSKSNTSEIKAVIKYVLRCIEADRYLPFTFSGQPRLGLFHSHKKSSEANGAKSESGLRYRKIIANYERFHGKKLYVGS